MQLLGKGVEQIAAGSGRGSSEKAAAGRMAVSTFAVRVAGAGLAFLSQIVLARLLGAYDYGIYSVAWTFVIVLGVMACGGFSTSASRFIPQYRQAGDLDGLRGFLSASRQAAFVIGVGTAIRNTSAGPTSWLACSRPAETALRTITSRSGSTMWMFPPLIVSTTFCARSTPRTW